MRAKLEADISNFQKVMAENPKSDDFFWISLRQSGKKVVETLTAICFIAHRGHN